MTGELSRELLVFDSGWPPAVIIRRRSRRISLRLDSAGGLRVNAPTYVSQREIKQFILKNLSWVERQQLRSNQTFEQLSGQRLGQFIQINHVVLPKLGVSSRGQQLTLARPAGFDDWAGLYELGRDKIKRLINKQAKIHLLDEARQISDGYKKQPATVRLRYMRSRWGSCHPKGIITLNSQLIRLPAELRSYVIHHELTHLEHPHHQPDFWSALETKVKTFKQARRQLRAYALWY